MGILREKRNHFVVVNFVYFECSCENASVDEVSCHCHTLFWIQITKISKKVAGLDRREKRDKITVDKPENFAGTIVLILWRFDGCLIYGTNL